MLLGRETSLFVSFIKAVWMFSLLACSASRRGAQAFCLGSSLLSTLPLRSVTSFHAPTRQLRYRQAVSNAFNWARYSNQKGSACTTSRLFASDNNRQDYNDRGDDDDDNWKVPDTIYIPEESLDLSFVRSGGAGGQNVNKVNTQVQLKVLIDGMGWVPYEVRQRLRQQQANRVNKEGFLVIHSQEHRTQMANRKAAIQKLREMILQAWPRPKQRNMRTGISEKTKKQRREYKEKRKLVKESRRSVQF